MLTTEARGDYVCNIDDDDRVPDDYVSAILGALESDPDYVGFEVEVLDIGGTIGLPGRKYRAVHSLETKTWHQKGDVFYRHVSHLNPVRRDLALRGVWEGNYAEDHRWADSVVEHVNTEVFIDRPMYFYDMDNRLSLRGDSYDDAPYERPVLPGGFRYHPDSEV
jgi:glycosyltransferase involved in cell wall biosynthesis